jgi:branched-chain amino acid transport system substrate-binding protein
MPRLRRTLLAGAILAPLVAACNRAGRSAASSAVTSSEPILLGTAGPWTEGYGQMNKRGMDLAVADINAAGGVNGRPLQLVSRDDGGSAVKATAIAEEFVGDRNIVAVVGHVNSGAMVAAARVYDGHLAAVATGATSPALTGISPWAFRVISSDSSNAHDIALFARQLGRSRAAILYENNSYGRGLADAFRRAYTGRVVSMDPIAEDKDQRFDAYLEWFKRSGVDIVFVAGSEDSGLAFLREARAHGLAADLLGGDGWSGLSTDTLRAQGVYVGVPFTAEDPRPQAQRFVNAFTQRFHMSPDNNAALAYDATMLLYVAATNSRGDRRAIRDYLAALTPATAYQGVTGAISFGTDGDPVGKNVVMTRIDHGTLRLAEASR